MLCTSPQRSDGSPCKRSQGNSSIRKQDEKKGLRFTELLAEFIQHRTHIVIYFGESGVCVFFILPEIQG